MTSAGKDVDSGWAWIVLVAATMSLISTSMLLHSPGIIVAEILETIDDDLSAASWVGSLSISTLLCTGPIAALIVNKLGCRLTGIVGGIGLLITLGSAYFCKTVWSLTLTYGILTGFGFGVSFSVAFVAVGQYFDKHRALASGIASSGIALGTIVGPMILRLLIDEYNLNGMFLIMGAVCFHVTPLSMLIRPSPFEVSQRASKNKNPKTCLSHLDFFRIFKNKSYVFYLISFIGWSAGESTSLIQLPLYAEVQGSTKFQAATLFTAYGSFSFLSRILTGMAANSTGINNVYLHTCFIGIVSVFNFTFPLFSDTFETQMVYASVVGMYSGGNFGLLNALVADIVGLNYHPYAFGFVYLATGLTYIAVPSIAAFIVDTTGDMANVFYFGGCVMFLGFCSGILSGSFVETKPTACMEYSDNHGMETFDKKQNPEHMETNIEVHM